MRMKTAGLWIAALALAATACGPHQCPRPPHGPGMMMGGCGPDACGYESTCFSEGAVHSNAGVCQACTDGKWVAATGCHECGCKMDKGAPCDHEREHREHHRPAK